MYTVQFLELLPCLYWSNFGDWKYLGGWEKVKNCLLLAYRREFITISKNFTSFIVGLWKMNARDRGLRHSSFFLSLLCQSLRAGKDLLDVQVCNFISPCHLLLTFFFSSNLLIKRRKIYKPASLVRVYSTRKISVTTRF